VLESDSRVLPVTGAFAEITVRDLPLETEVPLCYRNGEPSGLLVTAFAVPGDAPRFARHEISGHTVGLLLRDAASGGRCAFIPGCGGLEQALLDRLNGVDLLLFDGTFWREDELIGLGIGDRTASSMGHVPVGGPGGSLEALSRLRCPVRIYTHINNSNPMLIEDSPERALVERSGFRVGDDGMRFTV
jgi:pyrroloquinoline quinone biosynthesis protein B